MSEFGNLEGLAPIHQNQLAPLRRLILDTAALTKNVGEIAESVKWREPSYTPYKKGIGSSIRLAARKDGKVSMNFICHTGLVARFRELYAQTLEFEGNRTIVIDPALSSMPPELSHCIAMALTYHLAK